VNTIILVCGGVAVLRFAVSAAIQILAGRQDAGRNGPIYRIRGVASAVGAAGFAGLTYGAVSGGSTWLLVSAGVALVAIVIDWIAGQRLSPPDQIA
jgi:hypothetical protein